ncbi:hypothetical protein ACF1B4_31470, partial [Streptomyces albidoflavus]
LHPQAEKDINPQTAPLRTPRRQAYDYSHLRQSLPDAQSSTGSQSAGIKPFSSTDLAQPPHILSIVNAVPLDGWPESASTNPSIPPKQMEQIAMGEYRDAHPPARAASTNRTEWNVICDANLCVKSPCAVALP